MLLVAQVSDTHFDLGTRNYERAERVMAYLAELRHKPDAIVVTGDITDSGQPEQYAEARMALQADIPVFPIPGNHDERSAFREILLGVHPSDEPINQVRRVGELTLVLLDSTVPGRASGHLTDETIRWLGKVLGEAPADKPILLVLHHPPVRLHSPIVDDIALTEPEHLAEMIADEERIIGVLTGHAHSAAISVFAGRPLLVGPSTASVLGGVWELGPPDRVMDYAPEPAVALHIIDADHRLTTHFRTVPMGGWISTPNY
ncbi:metallophosphoesterase [Nocardia paucivorans]|uniref:metallophosphoesterase n=1 Tax=Nocardia paucivorans TaxID=114259 RepID=UPI0003111948|nr:metallophosphoesterase [Nocardia paucivorans]